MKQEQFERWLAQAARDYNAPPETPREEMWAVIRGRRERHGGQGMLRAALRFRGARPSWEWWGVGVAAALLLGVALGRWAPRAAVESAGAPPAAAPAPAGGLRAGAYEFAALEHLRRAETYLMLFRAEARSGRAAEVMGAPAEDLLLETRLFLESPVADDPAFRSVLDDLELVLAQIVQLRTVRGRQAEELEFINQGIEQRGVLFKLRSAIGPSNGYAVQGES